MEIREKLNMDVAYKSGKQPSHGRKISYIGANVGNGDKCSKKPLE